MFWQELNYYSPVKLCHIRLIEQRSPTALAVSHAQNKTCEKIKQHVDCDCVNPFNFTCLCDTGALRAGFPLQLCEIDERCKDAWRTLFYNIVWGIGDLCEEWLRRRTCYHVDTGSKPWHELTRNRNTSF